jgi:alpha-L-fucosidase
MHDTRPIRPSRNQLAFLDWEFGVFLTFGIRTFYEGHVDWDGKEMPLAAFDPHDLDCDKWMETISNAGARYAVLVVKHHDGFANWPSAFTSYSVANTPWKGGKGDVVQEFTDACRLYGVKVGLYYSPAEWNLEAREASGYDQYFINQITELLTGYGRIDYLWFDGCGSENHRYDTERIMRTIRHLQPEILTFHLWDPDTRWVGNEAGLAPWPCWNTVKTVSEEMQPASAFLPAECDCRMRQESWFSSNQDEDTVKSLEDLMGIYYYSVGRGANLLLNIGPDRSGRLPERDAIRLLEFGSELKRRFSNPIASLSDFRKEGSRYICRFDEPTRANHLVACENLVDGERVSAFRILAQPIPFGESILVFEGKNMGHKAICSFPTVTTCEFVLEFPTDECNPCLKTLELFHVMDGPPVTQISDQR